MMHLQQFDEASDSPTPTPMNTATHTPAPSTRPTPWSSPKLGPSRDVLRFHNLFDLRSMNFGAAAITRRAKFRQLALYFVLNLSLTMMNKALMAKFPYPYLLTSLHAGFGTLGCHYLRRQGHFSLGRLTSRERTVLMAFSFLYTINIALSNVSLNLVTIPFHQVVRATTPVFTLLIDVLKYGGEYSKPTYVSLIPVIAGVGFATYGDYYCTPLGFLLTLLGAVIAAVKTIVTNRIQTGTLRLPALEILYRMGPLAFGQSILYAYVTGEVSDFKREVFNGHLSINTFLLILINGLTSFGLNVVSFTANKKTGPLTMTVAANVKQILTIVLSTVLFRLKVGVWNTFGIFLTLLGGIWYAKVGMDQGGGAVGKKQDSSRTAPHNHALPLSKRLEDIDEERAGDSRYSNGIAASSKPFRLS
ncbi:MAG: UAA transporter [Peltula sp. TS41687]|nr:MAG: UAA transporter [Peltula sp. TS41687]